MQAKQHVLIAAQPAAAAVVHGLLDGILDFTTVHTIEDGRLALESKRGSITLVISTIAFDESRMLDFLAAVKARGGSGTPFLCCRVLPTVLAQHSMERLGEICRDLGAVDFVDFATLDQRDGAS